MIVEIVKQTAILGPSVLNMTDQKKAKIIGFRPSAELEADLQAAADATGLSISKLINECLKRHLVAVVKKTVAQGAMAAVEMEHRIQRRAAEFTESPHRVPLISLASAGDGGDFYDIEGQYSEIVYTSNTRDANAYAIEVQGDSMVPTLHPKDRVVCSPNSIAKVGDIVVVRELKSGNVWVKRLLVNDGEKVQLGSDNAEHKTRSFKSHQLRFIHPVVDIRKPSETVSVNRD